MDRFLLYFHKKIRMNHTFKWIILGLFATGCLSTQAQTVSGLQFADFPAKHKQKSKPVKPDFTSSPGMEKQKANIQKRFTGKVNFAGAYEVLTWGCGTGCLTGALADLRTGKLYELPPLSPNNCGRKSVQAKDDRLIIKKNSRLLLSSGCGMQDGNAAPPLTVLAYEWNEETKAFEKRN